MRNKHEEYLESNKKLNTELTDEEFANASGGALLDSALPKFKVGDHVRFPGAPDEEAFITGIYGLYPNGWYYNIHARDKDGWYDDIEWEKNMAPY